MAIEVLIVNGERYLVNTESKGVDDICDAIIDNCEAIPVLDWDEVKKLDLKRKL